MKAWHFLSTYSMNHFYMICAIVSGAGICLLLAKEPAKEIVYVEAECPSPTYWMKDCEFSHPCELRAAWDYQADVRLAKIRWELSR